jgi:hypothetical protein
MSTNVLDITNVVTISVATPQAGLANYQINNLLYCTKETPIGTITNFAVYNTPAAVATDWGTSSETYAAAVNVFAQSPNIQTGGGVFIVHPMASGDALVDAINTMLPLAYFGGVCYGGYAPNDTEVTNAVTACNTNKKLLFVAQSATSVLTAGTGLYSTLSSASNPYMVKLLYTVSATESRKFASAFASSLMSCNFAGSNTTKTMHLKTLVGVAADTGISQTVLGASGIANTCFTLGVQTYINLAGLPKVFCSNADNAGLFPDQVYNRTWLLGALQVAGFNALATTNTKVPQTEEGVGVLRGAYLNILEQAVANGFLAPGTWNGSDRFGNPEDFLRSVASYGYYLYSQPVSQQAQADRTARKAPVIQIAGKEAGAIHSSSVIVYVEA